MYTRVMELRMQKNVSQLTLATRIGCSQNTISRIEKGECEPKADLLIEMARYFGVSTDYLLGLCDVRNYTEACIRYGRLPSTVGEYQSKLNQLSDQSRELAQNVVNRLIEIEKQ